MSTTINEPSKKSRHRLLRGFIWFLLVASIGTSIPLAVFVIHPARQRHLAAEHLSKDGGVTLYFLAYVSPKNRLPVWLREQLRLDLIDHVYDVRLNGMDLNQTHFSSIAQLDRLGALELDGTNTEDQDLPRLYQLKRLRSLSLSNTNVTEAGIEHLLQEMSQLEEIDLRNTAISAEKGREFEKKYRPLMVLL